MDSRIAGYDDIVLVAPTTVPYEQYSIQSAHWFIGRALSGALEQSGLRKDEIDGLCVSSFSLAPDTGIGLVEHLGMLLRWLDYIPMGGASGIMSLRRAARAVQNGDANVVACLAGDSNHVDSFRLSTSNFSRFARDAVYPIGSGGPNASFALLTAHYMENYGATREDFAKIAVAQRENALKTPHALFKKPLTMEIYLNSRVIADPICLFDCVMPCAGAEGFLVMRQEKAEDLDLPYVRILNTIERHNAFRDDPIQIRGGWAMDCDILFEGANVDNADIDFFQSYDDYPVITMYQIEDLGFCAKGKAPEFVRNNTFTTDGTFPLNTSGGQLSVGQAGAAGGYLGLVEAIRQLTGKPLGSAVPDARIGLVSGFGMINYDRGLSSGAAILAAGKKDHD